MKYIIDEKDLYELIVGNWELNLLYNYGVDNWEGYGEYDEDDRFSPKDVTDYINENFKTLDNIKKIIDNEKVSGIETKLMIKDILEGIE